MKWKGYTVVELLVTVLIIALLMFGVSKCSWWAKSSVHKVICGSNTKVLAISLRQYASDNQGQYPPSNKWCDLLFERSDLYMETFLCRVAEVDMHYYSKEPNESNASNQPN